MISIDPGYSDAYFNKGNALEALGKKAEARDEFEKYRMVRKTGGGSPSLLEFDSKMLGTLEQYEFNVEEMEKELAKQQEKEKAATEK